jgi:sterol desaturase/sphingolipid hydroxylase (fatty acid hydroxylase superfamily)
MNAALLDHEPLIRLALFAGIFVSLALLERVFPVRQLGGRAQRWRTNIAMSVAATALARLVAQFILPIAGVGLALVAQAQGIGLFNTFAISPFVAFVVSLFALDGLIYGQHVVFHKIDLLWRIHRVHHADPDLDVTTAVRFHPIEILLSLFVKAAAILALGVPPLAVIVFEVLLNGIAMFNHSNLQLGATANRLLSLLIVTPDMHRVHHSIERDEQNSNFGFNLSLWDRMFGTYRRAEPIDLAAMRIGLDEFGSEHDNVKPTEFIWSFMLPFVSPSSPPPIAKQGEHQK